MTINGPGASNLAVSGTGTSRVFEILAGQNVTVTGLTITRGYAPDEGAGILNDGSNLTLSGDIVSQNVAYEGATTSAQGGGIESLGGPALDRELAVSRQPGRGGQRRSRISAMRSAEALTWPRGVPRSRTAR